MPSRLQRKISLPFRAKHVLQFRISGLSMKVGTDLVFNEG